MNETSSGKLSCQPAINSGVAGSVCFEPEKHLPMFCRAGFQTVEIGSYDGPSRFVIEDSQNMYSLLHVANDLSIKIWSVHVPDEASLAAKDETNRQMQVETVRRFIDIAGELGVAVLCVHTRGNLHGEKTDSDSVLRLRESLHDLGEYLRAVSVKVCLETTAFPKGNGVLTNHELVAEIKKLEEESFGLLLDVGHSNIAGNLYGTPQLAGKRLGHLHIHDNIGSDDLHQIPGRGTIGWSRFIADLREAKYEGPMMLEIVRLKECPLPVVLDKCYQAAQWLLSL